MSRALRIYQADFDKDFFALSGEMRARIGAKLDEMGMNLRTFQHYQMTGSNRYRLRVGDYRVIYTIDVAKNEIHLLAVGHRREIYR